MSGVDRTLLDHADAADRSSDKTNGTSGTSGDKSGAARQRTHHAFALKPWKDITYEPGAGNWLLHGLLPAEGLAIVFGKAKSFKSFILLDLGVAIADERCEQWAGRKVKHGAVVYIVAEGRLGMRKRIEAYKRHRAGCDADLPFFIIEARPDLGTRPSDKDELIAVIRAALPDLTVAVIIIDTLARTLGGADENGEGMRNFADNAEDVAESFGCLAIAVHHEGHEGGRKRGHSSLGGANVASVRVAKTSTPGSGVYTADVVVEEAKDGEDGIAFAATLKLVDVEGETTLLIDTVVEKDRSESAPKAGPPSKVPKWELALPVLLSTLADFPMEPPNKRQYPTSVACTTVERFKRELQTTGIISEDNEGTARSQFKRIRDELRERKLYLQRDKLCWHPEKP